jgi:hypothetical protein
MLTCWQYFARCAGFRTYVQADQSCSHEQPTPKTRNLTQDLPNNLKKVSAGEIYFLDFVSFLLLVFMINSNSIMSIDPLTATASELQAKLTDGSTTSQELIKVYLKQIKEYNGYFKAVLAVTPENLLFKRAAELDDERKKNTVRGPLHGIPILIKV